MEISFHSHFDSNTVIATKFCTWHDSCAVVACAKNCCDLMASNGVMTRRNFHRIWVAGKKTLVKRAPGSCVTKIIGWACSLAYRQVSNIWRTKSQYLKKILGLSCACLCRIPWSQMSSREWICCWSSADKQCSNYIWVIDNFIAC